MATVVMLVALRIGLGFHFFYEGVWKVKNYDKFTAEPFLSQAKGPMAPLFYAMLPDINGRSRLAPLEVEAIEEKDENGKVTKVTLVRCEWLTDRWEGIRREFAAFYRPKGDGSKEHQDKVDAFERKVEDVFGRFKRDVERNYLVSVESDLKAFYASLDRFEQSAERSQGAPFQKERRWNDMMKLRQEAQGWIRELETREANYQRALYDLLDEDQRELGAVPASWNPFDWGRMGQINFAVTFALTAMGLCLILGLFTRLAALGGAGFMFFVVLTQPAWPGIYPPDPPVVGHALLINKDFVEMLALLTIATTLAGRWAGLDYFIHHLIVDPIMSRYIRKEPKA
jgi:uncharacterized membrane protein YphA (DoxX/SURF4 family)